MQLVKHSLLIFEAEGLCTNGEYTGADTRLNNKYHHGFDR